MSYFFNYGTFPSKLHLKNLFSHADQQLLNDGVFFIYCRLAINRIKKATIGGESCLGKFTFC